MNDRVRSSQTSHRTWIFSLLAAVTLTLQQGRPAKAAFTIEIAPANINAAAGSANNAFNVFLVSDANTPLGTTLSSFEVTLVAALSGISFTGADTVTGQPYVFAGNSIGFTFGHAGLGAGAADISDFANNFRQPIAASTTYGLGEIFFKVDAGATLGVYTLNYDFSTILIGPPPDFNPLPFTTTSAQITVTPPSVVPEPSTLILLGVGLVFAGSVRARRFHSA